MGGGKKNRGAIFEKEIEGNVWSHGILLPTYESFSCIRLK